MEGLRRHVITVPLPPGNVAVANAQVQHQFMLRGRIEQIELALGNTGTGAGQTQVTPKLNGTAIIVGGLTIASASGTNTVVTPAPGGGLPAGAVVNPGDLLTVDVNAVPGTTPSANAVLYIQLAQQDT